MLFTKQNYLSGIKYLNNISWVTLKDINQGSTDNLVRRTFLTHLKDSLSELSNYRSGGHLGPWYLSIFACFDKNLGRWFLVNFIIYTCVINVMVFAVQVSVKIKVVVIDDVPYCNWENY